MCLQAGKRLRLIPHIVWFEGIWIAFWVFEGVKGAVLFVLGGAVRGLFGLAEEICFGVEKLI